MSCFPHNRLVRLVLLVSCLLMLSISVSLVAANPGAVRTNAGFTANTLPGNDDDSTGLVNIGFTVNFFGISANQLYINNNGNVTFDSPLSSFTPFPLLTTTREMIAPFFADVDTRASTPLGFGTDTVNGHAAFAVNWVNVGYFDQGNDKLNSFQLVLIDRSDTGAGNFDFEFNYDQIQWEAGDDSGGSDGLGGNSARVGYSNGSTTSLELTGSAVNGALIDGGPDALTGHDFNSGGQLGRYVFQVRNGSVVVGPPGSANVLTSCLANPQSDSVVGSMPYTIQAFYAPGKISPNVFLNPGTYWVLGQDSTHAYYEIILSCQFLWVPVQDMAPDYDANWQGRPLPTRVVGGSTTTTKK